MLTTPTFPGSARPVFIIGAPRSGTSITTWAVGQLPNVQPMPETSWIASLATGAYNAHTYGAARGEVSHLSNVGYELGYFLRRIGEAVDKIVQDCFRERCMLLYGPGGDPSPYVDGSENAENFHVRRRSDDPKRRWIDGTPYNTFFAWALAEMFPQAQFIHNLRNPGDVATSLEGLDKFGQPSHELEEGLRVWSVHTEAAGVAERAFGRERIFRLDFKRISSEPEPLLRELCDFLGEEFTTDCLGPLRSTINSSGVDERRQANAERMDAIAIFNECRALYDGLVRNPPTDHADPSALEILRERFFEHCRHHPLI